MRSRRGVLGLFVTMTLLMSALLSVNVAMGHGWVTGPPSRQDMCAKGRTPFDCGPVKYEPQSVEAPKGSMLCSGGGSYSILDNHSLAWPVTSVGSSITIQWNLTAAHRTTTWEYFLDGSLFRTFNQNNTQPPSNIAHSISGLPSGRHRILARWNIADTPMAFYNCIDINVGGGTVPTATRTRTATSGGTVPTATRTRTATSGGTVPTATRTRTNTTSSGTTTWAPGVYYAVGATVSYGGVSYRCAQAHTSQVGWEPPNVPALWTRL